MACTICLYQILMQPVFELLVYSVLLKFSMQVSAQAWNYFFSYWLTSDAGLKTGLLCNCITTLTDQANSQID